MADIEDRVLKHSHAFKGLLSLVSVDETLNKRKQTKEEKRKEAKKAKLDSKVNGEIGKAIVEKKKVGKEKETPQVSVMAENDTRAKKQEGQGRKKKQKQQTMTDDKTTTTIDRENNADGNVSGGEKLKSVVPKPLPQKIQKPKNPQPPKESHPPSALSKDTAAAAPTESLLESSSSSTDPADPSATTTITSLNPNSTQITPTARAEARARLAARIDTLRAHRKAKNPNDTTTRSRQDILDARQKKEAARKERKKALWLAAKATEGVDKSGIATDAPSPRPPPSLENGEKLANNFMFGAITFDDGQQLDHTLADFKKSRKRKGPTDVMGQIKHVEAKKARLETMDPEKREKIYEKELWSKALKQTVGEKVRDDEKLLKKALKRQEHQKKKSEREWKERKDSVSKGIAMRQKKREENINARKEQKKLGKAGKKPKTGGKKKVQKGKKRGVGSNFESGLKSSKPVSKPGGARGGKRFGK